MKLLRLPRQKVQIGAPLPWNVRDTQGKLLLSRGHVVENEHQLEALLERGAFVDALEVQTSVKGVDVEQAKTPVAPLNLFGLWDQLTLQLEKLLHVAQPVPDLPQQVQALAEQVLALVDRDADIGIYRAVRQDHAHAFYYGYAHCVHTAMMCILMCRRLQWPASKMMSLVNAALTMNMTILDLQGQMAAQDVPMKDRQRAAIHAHPAKAVEALKAGGVTDEDWLMAVAHHHERADGSGYPLGLGEVSEIGVALRVNDVFMAKISPRVLRPALSSQEAARQLFREDKGGPVSMAIIKEFGIYPPGDFVSLASGELAVVVRRTDNAKAPIVAAITDTAGHPIVKTVRHDTSKAGYNIVGPVADKSILLRMPPERLYGFSEL